MGVTSLQAVLSTPAPLTREHAFALLDEARLTYREVAARKLLEIEVLGLGQTAHGELSRFDTAYENAKYTNDFFIDEIAWSFAQKATRDMAGIAGAVGDEGVATVTAAVEQLGSDLADEAGKVKDQIADVAGDAFPLILVGLFLVAVIVVMK
jgi:hypothetical protein